MSKKNRQNKRQPVPSEGGEPASDDISALGLKVMAAGVAVIASGFWVLSKADAMGGNWAAHLSPFLILGGYLIVGLGIFAPEKLFARDNPSPSPGLSDQK